MFVFSHVFLILWEFTFPIFWELYGFLLHSKSLRNPLLQNVCFFSHAFPVLWKFTFSQVLGILWISASSKIFRKPISLKCLCFSLQGFSILCQYNRNPFFPCFGNGMDFCIKQKIQKHLTLKCLVFLIFFPSSGNSLFPYFENCMDFCFIQNF